jgi:hypothetical protein
MNAAHKVASISAGDDRACQMRENVPFGDAPVRSLVDFAQAGYSQLCSEQPRTHFSGTWLTAAGKKSLFLCLRRVPKPLSRLRFFCAVLAPMAKCGDRLGAVSRKS